MEEPLRRESVYQYMTTFISFPGDSRCKISALLGLHILLFYCGILLDGA